MSATASKPPSRLKRLGAFLIRYWPEALFAVFCAANFAAIVLVPSAETVPFHFVWVALTLVYGLRAWRLRPTVITLAVVILLTGVTLSWALVDTAAGFDELAEVPLMATMFLVVMNHVDRRQTALDEVSRLAESERRLVERERNLVRDVSHELRTPITVARGHAELIHRNAVGQTAEDAEVVLDELARLSRIAERLLILAAAEHPEFLRRAPVEVERLIVDTARRWSPAAPRRWTVDAPVDGVLYADEERLESTLDALVENAVKFTDEGDAIRIEARHDGSVAIIEVSDTGVGIPADQLSRIFDRFSRVDEGRRRRNGSGGTGLGLPIVKAIVEAHGGSVGVRSELGKGTTFSLRIPGFRSGHAGPPDHAPAPAGTALPV
jgi:signal transduction histidine kinase